MSKTMTGAERKASILEAGAKLASKHGAMNVTRRMVAKAAKVSEALVSTYMGGTDVAQRAYARKAKALKLPLPDKATAERLGAKLRAHGPRDKRDTRKRSAKEVEAIKRKSAAKKPAKVASKKSTARVAVTKASAGAAPAETKPSLPAAKRERKPATPKAKPQPAPATAPLPAPPEVKTAAREPKAPPVNLVNLL